MAKAPTYISTRSDYARLWQGMKIDPANRSMFDTVARRLYKHIKRYQVIERLTGVPAVMVAVIHERESGADFDTYLGNGQPLSRKTTIVPKGRGPFGSFTDGAVDALTFQGLTDKTHWTLERVLYHLEAYNGWGYRLYRGINSPYLWAGTSNYTRGKYIKDGVWDAGVEDRQMGCAGILAALFTVDPSLRVPMEGQGRAEAPEISLEPPRLPPDVPRPLPPPQAPMGIIATILAATGAAGTGLWKGMNMDWFGFLIVAAIVLGFAYLAVPNFRRWVNAKLGLSWNPPKGKPPVDD